MIWVKVGVPYGTIVRHMPFLTRTRKRWIAVVSVALVAFAHAAIAASGCLTGSMTVSESGCEEHRPAVESTLVCRTHLQTETQTLDLAQLPQVLHLDVPVLVLTVQRAYVAIEVGLKFPAPPAFAGAPPLNLLYSRSLT